MDPADPFDVTCRARPFTCWSAGDALGRSRRAQDSCPDRAVVGRSRQCDERNHRHGRLTRGQRVTIQKTNNDWH